MWLLLRGEKKPNLKLRGWKCLVLRVGGCRMMDCFSGGFSEFSKVRMILWTCLALGWGSPAADSSPERILFSSQTFVDLRDGAQSAWEEKTGTASGREPDVSPDRLSLLEL